MEETKARPGSTRASGKLDDQERDCLRRAGVPYWDVVEPGELPPGRGALITGPVGCGKTWRAAEHAAAWVKAHGLRAGGYVHCAPRLKAVTSIELLDDLRDFGSDRKGGAVEELTAEGLLIVDDLGKEKPTQWALSKLWQVVDVMTREPGRVLVVTTQFGAADLIRRLSACDDDSGNAQAVVSRLALLEPVKLAGPDRRIARGRR